MRHLYDKKSLIYCNQTSLQRVLQNKLNIEYFTCGKLMDKFYIYISSFAYMNKLGNWSVVKCDTEIVLY